MIGRIMLGIALGLAQGASAETHPLNGFRELTEGAMPGLFCLEPEALCLGIDGEGRPFRHNPDTGEDSALIAGSELAGAHPLTIWPQLIRGSGGHLLAGLTETASLPYSGGGYTGIWLHLFELTAESGTPPRILATFPLDIDVVIRACFNAADEAARAGYCHDIYTLDGSLKRLGSTTEGLPDLQFTSRAARFPPQVSRSQDNSGIAIDPAAPAPYEACSYTRIFRYDAGAGRYLPETPEPDCDEFLINN